MFCGNLFRCELYALPSIYVPLYINIVSSTKCVKLNEKSSIFWHKRLDHISRQRMERLVKGGIILDLDFSYFDTCIDYIEVKLIVKIRNVKVDKYTELLGVIHTDICGTFAPPTIGGLKYFITFIDDYSYYGFVELIQ